MGRIDEEGKHAEIWMCLLLEKMIDLLQECCIDL